MNTAPTISLNGSSADSLVDAAVAAVEALRIAWDAVSRTEPNARDYQGRDDDFRAARCAHADRLRRIHDVRAEINEIAEAIADVAAARGIR